jgi:hypothetical protein
MVLARRRETPRGQARRERKAGNFTRAICGLRLAFAYRRHGGGAIGHGAAFVKSQADRVPDGSPGRQRLSPGSKKLQHQRADQHPLHHPAPSRNSRSANLPRIDEKNPKIFEMTGGTGHEDCFASSSDASDLDVADLGSASTMPSLLRKRYVSLDGRPSRHRGAPMYETSRSPES